MVVGVGMHAFVNWTVFKRYFLSSTLGRSILLVSAILLAVSFVEIPQVAQHQSPPVMALNAVSKAPLNQVAELAGQPVESLMLALKDAGIMVTSAEASLASVVANDRAQTAKAMHIIFANKQN